MSVLAPLIPQRKPRLGVQIDQTYPISQSLAACWAFNGVAEHLVVRDLLGIHDAVINLATITPFVDGVMGQGLQSAATASSTAGASIANSALLSFPGPGGFGWDAWLIDDGSDTFGAVCTLNNTEGVFIRSNRLYLGGFGADIDTVGFPLGTGNLIYVSISQAPNGDVSFYHNGRVIQTTTPTQPNNTIEFNLMFNDTVSETFIGKLFLMRLWHRWVRPAEFWELWTRRFAMFRMPSEDYAAQAGTPGGGLSQFFFVLS